MHLSTAVPNTTVVKCHLKLTPFMDHIPARVHILTCASLDQSSACSHTVRPHEIHLETVSDLEGQAVVIYKFHVNKCQ